MLKYESYRSRGIKLRHRVTMNNLLNIYRLMNIYTDCIARLLVHIFLCSKLYWNRSYAAIVQRKSRVRGQISAPSVPSCVCANELSFKICVFQVVKSPQSRQDRCYCYRRRV